MSSTEDVVNKMLGDLSRIPLAINSNLQSKNFDDIDAAVKKSLDKQIMELKSRGIV